MVLQKRDKCFLISKHVKQTPFFIRIYFRSSIDNPLSRSQFTAEYLHDPQKTLFNTTKASCVFVTLNNSPWEKICAF